MELSTHALKAALGHLKTHVALAASPLAASNADLRLALATAAIKSFEYTYEVAIKLIRRRLEADATNPSEIDALTFNELIRRATEAKLISGMQAWQSHRRDRNATSHAYHAQLAFDICARLPGFVSDAERLLAQLTESQDAS